MLIWCVILVRYHVCFFSKDDSNCTTTHEYRFDVTEIDRFAATSFPDVKEMRIQLTADMPVALSFARFWRENPKFVIEGTGGRRKWVFNESQNNNFEFDLKNVNVAFLGVEQNLRATRLALQSCHFDQLSSISTMSFRSDPMSLTNIESVESWSYILTDVSGKHLDNKTLILKHKKYFKQEVTLDNLSNNTKVSFYGEDLCVSVDQSFLCLILETPMDVTVNHINPHELLSFESIFARGNVSSHVHVISSRDSYLKFEGGVWQRSVNVICRGTNIIHHGGGEIPLSITGNETVLLHCHSSECECKDVSLKSGALNVTADSRARVKLASVKAQAVNAVDESLVVEIGDVRSLSDDCLVNFDGNGTFVFVAWHNPGVNRIVKNLCIEPNLIGSDSVHFSLEKMPMTMVRGKFEISDNQTFPIRFVGTKLPSEDDVERYFGREYNFLCAKNLPSGLSMDFAETGEWRGFGRGMSIYESKVGDCLRISMSKHITSVNNVFCLGDGVLCPRNATVIRLIEEAQLWPSFLDVSTIEDIHFFVASSFEDFVFDFENFHGNVHITGINANPVSVTVKSNVFRTNFVSFEGVSITVEDIDTWDGKVFANLSIIRSFMSEKILSRLSLQPNRTLKIQANQIKNLVNYVPNLEVFDIEYDEVLFRPNKYVFTLNGSEVCIVENSNSLSVHPGSSFTQTFNGESSGALEIADTASRTILLNGTGNIPLRFNRYNGMVISDSQTVSIDTFGDSNLVFLESLSYSFVYWNRYHLNNALRISDRIKTLRFLELTVSSGHFLKSPTTEIVADHLYIPPRCDFSFDNLAINDAIHISPGATLAIRNLTMSNDIFIELFLSGDLPYAAFDGNTTHTVHVFINQNQKLPVRPQHQIPIACFSNVPFLIDSIVLLSKDIKVDTRGTCLVLMPVDASDTEDRGWAIVVSVCMALILICVGILIFVRCRRTTPTDSPLFAPLDNEFKTICE